MTQLHSIIRDNFNLPDTRQLTSETSFTGDLGADSFDMIQLAFAIEDDMDIKTTDPFCEDMETIGDLETFIADREKAK